MTLLPILVRITTMLLDKNWKICVIGVSLCQKIMTLFLLTFGVLLTMVLLDKESMREKKVKPDWCVRHWYEPQYQCWVPPEGGWLVVLRPTTSYHAFKMAFCFTKPPFRMIDKKCSNTLFIASSCQCIVTWGGQMEIDLLVKKKFWLLSSLSIF